MVASARIPATRAGWPVYIPHLTDQKDSASNRRLLAESQLRFQVISKTLCPVTPALPLTTLGDDTRWRTVPGSFAKTHAETGSRRSVRRRQRARACHADRRSLDRTQVDKDLVW